MYLEKFPNDLGKDTLIKIFLNYTDGDGDLGLRDSDTFPPYQFDGLYFYNLWVKMESLENGTWKSLINPFTLDTLNFNERLPYITPTGKNKWVQGNIELLIPASPFTLKPDSVRFKVILVDRSLKASKEAVSETLILNH